MRSTPSTVFRSALLALLLALAPVVMGCASLATTDLATFETTPLDRPADTVKGPLLAQVVWYLPNRMVDFLEMVNVGAGPFLSTSLLPVGDDFATTSVTGPIFYLPAVRWGEKHNLGWSAGVGAGLGWSGRGYSPLIYGWQQFKVVGDRWTVQGAGRGMPLKPDEIGFVAAPGLKLTFVPSEAWDFLAGLANLDPSKDDFDRRARGAGGESIPEATSSRRRTAVPAGARRGPVTLEDLRGRVEVQWPDEDWRVATPGEAIVNGVRLYTNDGATCRVVLPALEQTYQGRNYVLVYPLTEMELRKGKLPNTYDLLLLGGPYPEVSFAERAMNDRVRVVVVDEDGNEVQQDRPEEPSTAPEDGVPAPDEGGE